MEKVMKNKQNVHQGELLIRMCEERIQRYIVDQNNRPYIIMASDQDEPTQVYDVNSVHFKSWLVKKFRKLHGCPPTASAVEQAKQQLVALCHEGDRVVLNKRVGWQGKTLYYDLGRKDWSGVYAKAGEYGTRPLPAIFKRYSHQQEQVTPSGGGNISDIFQFVNISTAYRCLFLTVVVSYFIPDIPHPVTILMGEQGSGKSITAQRIVSLVDPSGVPLLAVPKNLEAAQMSADHHYVYALDNVSRMPHWLSDFLCRVVTGEGSEKRSLYTDDDSFIRSFRGCPVVNGIGNVVYRPDLLDRAVIFKMPILEHRKTERELLKAWDEKKDGIISSIFRAISKAMVDIDKLVVEQGFRMSDYVKWGMALAPHIGFSQKQFLSDYKKSIREKWHDVAENEPLIRAISEVLEEAGAWEGSATDLLEEIKKHETLGIPRAANALSEMLLRISPALRNIGISFERPARNSGGRKIILKKVQ